MAEYQKTRNLLVHKIEAATNSPFSRPDENAFLEICRDINRNPDGPSIALSTLISQLEKSAAVYSNTATFTLHLLDVCMNNCGYPFISELCKGDHFKKLETIITRGNCAEAIRTGILIRIESWQLAFLGHSDLKSVDDLHCNLLDSGVKFPDADQNRVDALKRMLPNRGAGKAPTLVEKPTASDARTTQLMQVIRHDLDKVGLDLPVFEATVGSLACTPQDDVTLRQLRETDDRLQALQRRPGAYVEPMTDPKFGSSKEKEAMLDEVMRVMGKINETLQQFHSFERMRGREKEKEGEEKSALPGTRGAPEQVQEPAAPVARTTQLLQAIHQDLDLVAHDLPAFEAMVGRLACTPPDDVTLRQLHTRRAAEQRLEEEESKSAATAAVTTAKNQHEASTTASAAFTVTAKAPAAAITNDAGPASTENYEILKTVSEAREAIQLFQALHQDISRAQVVDATQIHDLKVVGERLQCLQTTVLDLINASLTDHSAGVAGEADKNIDTLTKVNEDLLRCIENYHQTVRRNEAGNAAERRSEENRPVAAETAVRTGENKREAPKPSSAAATIAAEAPGPVKTNAAGTELKENNDILKTVSDAKEKIELFQALHQEISTSPAVDATQIENLQVVGEQLEALQKKVQELVINSNGVGGEAENALA